jgi:Phage P22-like portal protein
MAVINRTVSDNLGRIRKNVASSYSYFLDNTKRFREFREYVFRQSINTQQKTILQQLNRPIVEFNILEAYISRLLGEFSKHEPSIEVSPAEGVPVDQAVLDVVEGHIRHIFYQANKDSFAYEIYKDLLSGGYSVAKIWTDYAGPMSFDQQIYLSRVFDPTLVGFDPLARAPHKGDGHYSFEIYPMLEEDFIRAYPDAPISTIGYMRDIEGFNWSYKDAVNQKVVLLADYYEKKKRKVRIVKLANGRVMTMRDYEKLQKYWEEEQFIEQIPVVVGKPRWTELETVCNYKFIENEILEYQETDYTYLPHIFFDGNSVILTQGTGNNSYQMTRPYIYHAKGVQDMMNFAGQTMCNSMENLIQHKFIVMKEAIPQEQDYLEALNDIQRANTIVVNAFAENDPTKQIPQPIREVQNVPLPPEVTASFQMTGGVTQTILGSYASNLGKNDNDLSGKAVVESASVGNSAAMPYVVGYLQGLTQIGNVIVDLMPKYLVGKRTIPISKKDGERIHQSINAPGMPTLQYDEKAIKVNVEAGVNFQVQKNQAVEQIISLMHANEKLGQFFNDEDGGLPILVRNLTIYGADQLPEAVQRWSQKMQQQQQQAMQMQQQAMMQNPQLLRAQAELQKVQGQQQQYQFENQIEIAKMAIEKEVADAKILESEAKVSQAQIDSAVRLEESQTSLEVHALESASKLAEIKSRQHHDGLAQRKLEHEISKADTGVIDNDIP